MSELNDRYAIVLERIRRAAEKSSRNPDDIELIAVSKTRSLQEVAAVLQLGQTAFGENTIQDAMTKIPELSRTPAVWHFIGHLQSKKAKSIPGYFQWVHSVDSIKLAKKLSDAMVKHAPSAVLNCLIQINVSQETTKSGLLPTELPPFLEQLAEMSLPGLRWRGLMTIGVQGEAARTQASFSTLRELRVRYQNEFSLSDFDQLSMGMSNDYEMAIEEGATLVRVGTAIFGLREPR